jgi:hypothetical protein
MRADQSTVWHPMMKALLASLALHPLMAIAQMQGCSIVGEPQVSPSLVRLESSPGRVVIRRGKPLHTTLTLRAGDQGVYLPDYFGPFMETCDRGFATELLTRAGKLANKHPTGCATAGGPPQIKLVWLKPGETRQWPVDLPTRSIGPGSYCLYAEYLTSAHLLEWAISVPENKSLVAQGRVTALPVIIRIR